MVESGFYKIKDEYFELIAKLGGTYGDRKTRPIYCCMRDASHPYIYWGIPTSDVSHRTPKAMDRIKWFCALPGRDIRSCYYHIGKTNRPAIFKISSALPLSEKYVDGEYTSQGSHLILRDKTQIKQISRKLARILFDEKTHPDKYEQHMTSIKEYIIRETEVDA